MTRFEQLQHIDHLHGRIDALRESAEAFLQGTYEPNFTTVPNPEVWLIPHPHDDAAPNEWGRVALASVAAATAITLFAAANAFARPW